MTVLRANERQFQFHPIMCHFRCDASALAALQSNQPIAGHGPECAREVGLFPAGKLRQFVQRRRRLLRDDTQQFAIAG
jgi:hypothetical protein